MLDWLMAGLASLQGAIVRNLAAELRVGCIRSLCSPPC
jgi:hypothetical protein